MNLFKEKAALFVTAVMMIICSIAVFIAVKVTVVAVDRQEQEVRTIPPSASVSAELSAKTINTNKLNEQTLFFNGKKVDDISVFYSDKKEVILPIDQIFSKVGLKFRYYASDDIFEAELDGKKLAVRLGKDSFSYGDKKIDLPYVPVAAKEHILVPEELFSHLDGFSVNSLLQRNITFLNYYNDNNAFENLTAKLLKINDGIGGIWSFTGNKILWDRKNDYGSEEYFEASPDRSKYLLKSGKRVYIVDPDKSPEPYLINVSFWCSWSEDSKYLYWEDPVGGNPTIYDVEHNVEFKLENNLWRAESLDGYEDFSYGSRELVGYVENGGYRRISIKNISLNKVYTIIQKNGRIIAEGDIRLSPDKERILFKGADGIFKLANQDGSGLISIGEGLSAVWVTNNKVMIEKGIEKFLYDVTGKHMTITNSVWKMLGQATDGSIFYTDGSVIYAESGNMEIELMSLLWECDYIFASSIDGPYVILSKKGDKIFYAGKNTVTTTGRYNNMLRDKSVITDNIDLNKSVIVSPSKDTFLVMQKDDGLLMLDFLGPNLESRERIVLDYITTGLHIADNIEISWLSQNIVLLYTNKDIWLINRDNGIQIQKIMENDGASIEGTIIQGEIIK